MTEQRELARYRRHFHAHPELSLQERETAAFIERELRDAGFGELRTGIGKTGILATLTGAKPGPVTLLRADMDGLPVTELNDVEYRVGQSRRDARLRSRRAHGDSAMRSTRAHAPAATTSAARSSFASSRAKKAMPETADDRRRRLGEPARRPHLRASSLQRARRRARSASATARSFRRRIASRSSSSAKAGTAPCRKARSIRSSPAHTS